MDGAKGEIPARVRPGRVCHAEAEGTTDAIFDRKHGDAAYFEARRAAHPDGGPWWDTYRAAYDRCRALLETGRRSCGGRQ